MKFRMLAALAVLCVPVSAEAHRAWMLPSGTVFSGQDPWVTVDAAVSNDLFYFEHFPLRLGNIGADAESDDNDAPAPQAKGPPPPRRGGRPADLLIMAPDGSRVQAQNGSTGRYRSTFDVHLTQKGTYRLAAVNDMVIASYTLGTEKKRWRGTADALTKEIPADAADLKVTHSQNRIEVFVTSGSPTDGALKPSGSGLELVPVTHPNDLIAGEAAKFRFVVDGKPAADLKVTVIPGGIRYRNQLKEVTVTTNADGEFAFTPDEPGMYWLNASVSNLTSQIKGATRRAGYAATLEVLPP